ncbi:MAG: CoA-binding protein [Chloroflexi bacterium]|nr:CoA-binding protein [Chloroflexota bacterium]
MSEEKEILTSSKVVAVVGISSKPEKPSHIVGKYLKEHGFKVIPVNPNEKEVLGEACYPDLKSVPQPVDVVDIFRRSEDVPPIVDQAVGIKAKVVWMQEGVINAAAAERARAAGLKVIMDKCMRKEHEKLGQ